MSAEPASNIEDYALIGDCETAALVGRDGSIDWLCWPRFDSDACFAALLGTAEHGRWHLGPADDIKAVSRRYREGTLILETCFETAGGAVRLIDFMPPRTLNSDVVRLVIGERGRVSMQMEFILRFGYGATVPWVTQPERGVLQAVAGPDMAMLHTSVPLHGHDLRTTASFEVRAGETIPFVLTYGPSHRGPLDSIDPLTALSSTEAFWREWVGRCKEAGPWSEAVKRSLITLKALTYAPTGGIVAAATTSLPELIGGSRNWDYRFCWLRDATLTLLALMDAGFFDEARAWRDWLLRAVAGSPNQMQIMYGLAGERRLTEWEVPWLPGYGGSRPVRIGNAAHGQHQLDVIGELMDALHQARRGGLPENAAAWALQCALLAHLSTMWHEPDEGIWEIRGPRQHFVHSKVMAWVAFDRGIRSAEAFGLGGPLEEWRRIRREIHEDVCTRGYDSSRGSFVQAYGSQDLDASLLLLPAVGFLPASDPRIVGTLQAVEHELVRDGLVLRYDTSTTSDGLPAGEGAFLACSFWLADAYVLLGRHEEATVLFERLLTLCNDVGLLSEEYDPVLRRQVGNVPQAFSHLALINTAHNLFHNRGEAPADQRAGSVSA
ncbi:glycoside hydrolase family 15 protein [Methylobacterium durans]|uniref:Trehalase n=1 Tax=Methylobacterium durans TaxID=2202825 RepID=A0A2U8WDW9_9HYPH|nr:glycoside hydrolase family 15 protein [Methylobacterium durans]AWN44385.1 glucoamylase [Methylobacterium durans]